jgi:hypothetical protein
VGMPCDRHASSLARMQRSASLRSATSWQSSRSSSSVRAAQQVARATHSALPALGGIAAEPPACEVAAPAAPARAGGGTAGAPAPAALAAAWPALPWLERMVAEPPACAALPVDVRMTNGGSAAGGVALFTCVLRAGVVCAAEVLALCDVAEDFGAGAVSGAHASNTNRLFAQIETASLCMMRLSLASLAC